MSTFYISDVKILYFSNQFVLCQMSKSYISDVKVWGFWIKLFRTWVPKIIIPHHPVFHT